MQQVLDIDLSQHRQDFPVLGQTVNGQPLVYLDNAATAQKPNQVIDAISRYYHEDNANVHRGIHTLSNRATLAYENARENVARFINAARAEEIIFTSGTTEAINMVAHSFGMPQLRTGDEIIISTLEHHANIVPWQIACEKTGANLKIIPIKQNGELDLEAYKNLFSANTKLVAIIHASNAIGTINPVQRMTAIAHQHHVPVLVDGAQAVPHFAVDVAEMGCDFYTFSAHKMYGPTGVGVLYGKYDLLEKMPPYQSGGEMITQVSFEKTTYNRVPHKFEAGTPNIAGVVGLSAAIDYIQAIGYENLHAHENALLVYATEALENISGLKIIGTAPEKVSLVSFILESIHPHDIGTILDQDGIAIRAGHHCTMPLMQHLGLPGTARASFAFYNTFEEIDKLIAGIEKVKQVMG